MDDQWEHRDVDALIVKYKSLVTWIVRTKFRLTLRHLDFDELVAYGMVGLWDAVVKFDPLKEVKFKTYAAFRITGAIRDTLREYQARGISTAFRKLERAEERLQHQLLRHPTADEVIEEVGGIELYKKLAIKAHEFSVLSLDYILQDDHAAYAKLMTVADPSENVDVVLSEDEMHAEQMRLIHSAISHLNSREQRAVNLYYFGGMTMREVAECMGVTESRISQTITETLPLIRGSVKRDMKRQLAA